MTRRKKSGSDWCAKATRVGELLPVTRWHQAVVTAATPSRKPVPWCVAFSGGADSLALLLSFWANFPERRERLVALHFNHRLRGKAADADAEFCRKVCQALGVRIRVGVWRAAPKTASEAAARAARHDFFSSEMKRLGARQLWLAHQQDDIAETMLMRLARGSGTGGLAAPRPVQQMPDRRQHLRPLLTVSKRELLAVLREAGVVWREDATNAGDDFFRNRVRRAVLPAWVKASGRDALAGAALARERLEEDDAALESWLDRLAALKRGELDLRRLEDAPRAVWRRALHRWLLAVRPDTDLSRQGFAQLLMALETGRNTRFSLGATTFAVIRDGRLTLKKR
jgi:tRNA(Ile)-lysidine synthase